MANNCIIRYVCYVSMAGTTDSVTHTTVREPRVYSIHYILTDAAQSEC